MDQETEIARAKWLLMGIFLFLASGCMSYDEAVYLVSGCDAVADITNAYESRSTRGASLTLEYTFTEPNGTHRKGMRSVPVDWPVPADGKVLVRYVPGQDGSSRLSGRPNWVGLGLFTLSLLWIAVFAFRLFREALDEPKPRPRRRRPD